MKSIKFLFIWLCMLLSCIEKNSKNECENFEYRGVVSLYGFDFKDIDTIKIKVFKKDSFVECIDSFYGYPKDLVVNKLRNERFLTLNKNLSPNNNFQFILNDSLKYSISNISIGLFPENTSFRTRYKCRVLSYDINGEKFKSSDILIFSPDFRERFEQY